MNSFSVDFDAMFEQIDREQGLTNFVKIYDLRQRLDQYSADQFDAGLRTLRLARKYSLDSADGNRVTLTQEQRDAGIREAGSLLVYCSR